MTGPPVPHLPAQAPIGKFIIGVSPIGSIPLFDYWATIISQYANSPILTTLISEFFSAADLTALADSLFDNMLNLNTAQGYGLDVWGRIVGVVRNINQPSVAGRFFGFDEPSLSYDPFNQSPFFSGQGLTNNVTLPDASFRLMILAKALSNISITSIPAINRVLLTLFPGRGNAYVTDDGGMHMTYHFNFVLTQTEFAILNQSGVLPKPAGVTATIVAP